MIRKNIYFVCNGTSMNDYINSINSLKSNETPVSFIKSLWGNKPKKHKKINLQNDPSILKIGLKEISLAQGNSTNNELFKRINRVYTSLDSCSLESSFILFNNIKNITIYPLPYMVSNDNINNIESLNSFKNKFGKLNTNNNMTIVNSYLSSLVDKNNQNIKISKDMNLKINWNNISTYNTKKTFIKTNNSILSHSHYSMKKFEKELINICKNHISDNILIITNGTFIKNILGMCKNSIFNIKKNIIETSSIWNIELSIHNDIVTYKKFNKEYPTPQNYKPLEYESNIYHFQYNNIMYPLFDSTRVIPDKYLNLIKLPSISNNITSSIKNKLSTINKNNTHIEKNKQNKISIENFK